MTETLTRIADAQYGVPFCDNQGRPMVAVHYDDGERFVTYAVPAELAVMTTPCPCGYTLTAHVHWTPPPAPIASPEDTP